MGESRKDCFAYKVNTAGKEGCSALRELYCREEKCKFYKTKEQLVKERGESNDEF